MPESWINKEQERSKEQSNKGKRVANPSAKKVQTEEKEKENYFRFKVKPSVEAEFRFIVAIRQGEEIKKGNKKPTIGDIFEELVNKSK